MTGFCKTAVPESIACKIESLKDNDEGLKEYGIQLAVEMCQKLLDKGTPGIHIYSLNMSKSALEILRRLKLISEDKPRRSLPWRASPVVKRSSEMVRPIFWSNRPKSYIKRTEDWDRFACNRWGDVRSPAYGTLSDYHFMHPHATSEKKKKKALEALGQSINNLDDVIRAFVKYTKGEISVFPWSEMDKMQKESEHISEDLVKLNSSGYLTINSQPKINGAPSTDPRVGWGGSDGFVYQKAYIEFFVSPEKWNALLSKIDDHPTLTYLATTVEGDVQTNMDASSANAVTWGVFPGNLLED